jgi:hypothetical protein
MPLIIPAFAQYQAPLVPLRGLWHARPKEGDKFVNAEIDWGTPGVGTAVQFALSGNSPVAMSQIVALCVDNGRCGADIQFVFPDSGFVLQVPGYNQGVYPVFTNALMFYAVAASNVALGDVTVIQIFNSMPPPVAIQAASTQQFASIINVNMGVNATTNVIPASVAVGTLVAAEMVATMNNGTASTQAANITLQDGLGTVLYTTEVSVPANSVTSLPINLDPLRLRFRNGVNVVISGTSLTPGGSFLSVNLYYQTP